MIFHVFHDDSVLAAAQGGPHLLSSTSEACVQYGGRFTTLVLSSPDDTNVLLYINSKLSHRHMKNEEAGYRRSAISLGMCHSKLCEFLNEI